ncbi:MAG TPA: DUF5309 family protein [Pseudolabrys sp.]|nr:DUF5309 family protein [Pseudolabrys sp.]
MPKVTNAFTTYQATANREDLSNAIYNIDPFDTPVMSAIRRRNVKNRIFDWQTEFLPIVNPNNAQVEGFSLANQPAQPTIRVNNVTQISERDATVSGTQEEADAAGKGSEMAHQMALASKVLKSDMETILCSRQARNDGNDTGPTARTTEAFSHWLGRAVDKHSNPAAAVAGVATGLPVLATDAFAAPAGASQIEVSEDMLGDAMQQGYTNGASPSLWIVPPGPKRTISTFTGRSTTQVLVGKTEVVSTIDVIATDFGRIKVAPSRWVPIDVGLLIDPDYAALAYFRAFRQYLMARTGDAETRMIVVEWGLEMRNPLAHVLFNGIKQ